MALTHDVRPNGRTGVRTPDVPLSPVSGNPRKPEGTFPLLLQTYRERSGMHMGELARRAGLSRSYVSRLESDKRPPVRETVIALADALPLSRIERERLLLSAGVWRFGVPDEALVWALLALIGDDE